MDWIQWNNHWMRLKAASSNIWKHLRDVEINKLSGAKDKPAKRKNKWNWSYGKRFRSLFHTYTPFLTLTPKKNTSPHFSRGQKTEHENRKVKYSVCYERGTQKKSESSKGIKPITFCTPVGRFNHGATVKLSDLTRFVSGGGCPLEVWHPDPVWSGQRGQNPYPVQRHVPV